MLIIKNLKSYIESNHGKIQDIQINKENQLVLEMKYINVNDNIVEKIMDNFNWLEPDWWVENKIFFNIDIIMINFKYYD